MCLGDRMSAADEWVNDMVTRYGMPRTEEFYRALLKYAFTSGQVHTSARSQQSLDDAFRRLDAAKVVA